MCVCMYVLYIYVKNEWDTCISLCDSLLFDQLRFITRVQWYGYMYICICMYVCMYVLIYMYYTKPRQSLASVFVSLLALMDSIYIYMNTYKNICTHMFLYVCVGVCVTVCVCALVCMYTQNTHTLMHTQTRTHTHTLLHCLLRTWNWWRSPYSRL